MVFGGGIFPVPRAGAGGGGGGVGRLCPPHYYWSLTFWTNWFPSVNSCYCIYYIKVELLCQPHEMSYIFDLQKRIIVATVICRPTLFVIIS